jgi:ribonuclease HI
MTYQLQNYSAYEGANPFYRDSYDIEGNLLYELDKPVKLKIVKNQHTVNADKLLSITNDKQVKHLKSDTKIFCDGACDLQTKQAGSGIAISRDDRTVELLYGDYITNGTNNIAELNGLYKALQIAKHEVDNNRTVTILCDSTYSIDSVTNWSYKWESKGWKKKGGEIKNLELIKKSFNLYDEIKANVEVVHVKAHAGVTGNELADEAATTAINTKQIRYINNK